MNANTFDNLDSTPAIHAKDISAQEYIGLLETPEDGETHIVKIDTPQGAYLVAGGACNAGLLPTYAVAMDSGFSVDGHLQALAEDLEAGDHPSGDLLRWYGSLVI